VPYNTADCTSYDFRSAHILSILILLKALWTSSSQIINKGTTVWHNVYYSFW